MTKCIIIRFFKKKKYYELKEKYIKIKNKQKR